MSVDVGVTRCAICAERLNTDDSDRVVYVPMADGSEKPAHTGCAEWADVKAAGDGPIMSDHGVPRANCVYLWSPAERAISDAIEVCERTLPADVRETEAIMLPPSPAPRARPHE